MTWRAARSLLHLISQEDAAHPQRSHASDGTIGDVAHQAQGSASDHNPRLVPALGPIPVVLAADITHDPGHGVDTYAQAEALRGGRDPRISYVISNRRIFAGAQGQHPWQWRSYAGSDPHTNHMHVSVVATAIADSETDWPLTTEAPMDPEILIAAQKIVDFVDPRIEAITQMSSTYARGPWNGLPVPYVVALKIMAVAIGDLNTKVDQLLARVAPAAAAPIS